MRKILHQFPFSLLVALPYLPHTNLLILVIGHFVVQNLKTFKVQFTISIYVLKILNEQESGCRRVACFLQPMHTSFLFVSKLAVYQHA